MQNDLEAAIDEALDGGPRAEELRAALAAVVQSIDFTRMEEERAETDDERRRLSLRRAELAAAAAQLREEIAIAEFVERSVRMAARRPRLPEMEQED
jgi:hypothetical protein